MYVSISYVTCWSDFEMYRVFVQVNPQIDSVALRVVNNLAAANNDSLHHVNVIAFVIFMR
jgi:hypothetical protein